MRVIPTGELLARFAQSTELRKTSERPWAGKRITVDLKRRLVMRQNRQHAVRRISGEHAGLQDHPGPDFAATEVIEPREGAFGEQSGSFRCTDLRMVTDGHRAAQFFYQLSNFVSLTT